MVVAIIVFIVTLTSLILMQLTSPVFIKFSQLFKYNFYRIKNFGKIYSLTLTYNQRRKIFGKKPLHVISNQCKVLVFYTYTDSYFTTLDPICLSVTLVFSSESEKNLFILRYM